VKEERKESGRRVKETEKRGRGAQKKSERRAEEE
jgi:hypothetical protein